MSTRRSRHLFLLEGVFFCSYCTLYAYIVSILLAYGYTEVQCGYVTMLQYLIILVVGPLYGQLIDRFISPKTLFIILLAGGLVATPFIGRAFKSGFGTTLLMVALLSLLDFCAANVLDTWVTAMTRKDESIDYGVIRSAGSVFYACTALISGYLIAPLGMDILFFLHFVLIGITIVLAWRYENPNALSDLPSAPVISGSAPTGMISGIKVLFSNRNYCIFLVSGTLYYFATRSINTFMQVILISIGGDVSSYGLSVFLYCVGECLMMQYASRLLRHGLNIRTLFIVSLLAMTVRVVLLSFIKDMVWVMVTQIFLSIGFGCFLRFNIEYVARLFPPEYSGRAILISVAVTQGIGCIIGNLFGGYLIADLGVPIYLLICGGLLLLALLVFVFGSERHSPVQDTT